MENHDVVSERQQGVWLMTHMMALESLLSAKSRNIKQFLFFFENHLLQWWESDNISFNYDCGGEVGAELEVLDEVEEVVESDDFVVVVVEEVDSIGRPRMQQHFNSPLQVGPGYAAIGQALLQ